MARVSKKVSAAQREAENAPHRIWKTAIDARLSDFDDVLRDTESLEVQISYIKEYINPVSYTHLDVYKRQLWCPRRALRDYPAAAARRLWRKPVCLSLIHI